MQSCLPGGSSGLSNVAAMHEMTPPPAASRFCPIDLAAIRQITLGVASLAWFLGQQHQGGERGTGHNCPLMSSETELQRYHTSFPLHVNRVRMKASQCAFCLHNIPAPPPVCPGLAPGLSPGEQLAAMGITGRSAGSWALIIYSALGPGALATYLQTKGQATVAATPSQVGRRRRFRRIHDADAPLLWVLM